MNTPSMTPMAAIEHSCFVALMNAMSRPGTTASIASHEVQPGDWGAVLTISQTLLDHEGSFAVLAEDGSVREAILRTTGSHTAPPEKADFLIADSAHGLEAVTRASSGDIEYPERGATVLVLCDGLGSGATVLGLTGPGIQDHAHLALDGLGPGFFAALAEKNSSFPLGMDVILVSSDGRVACLPRTTKIEVGHMQGGA